MISRDQLKPVNTDLGPSAPEQLKTVTRPMQSSGATSPTSS